MTARIRLHTACCARCGSSFVTPAPGQPDHCIYCASRRSSGRRWLLLGAIAGVVAGLLLMVRAKPQLEGLSP